MNMKQTQQMLPAKTMRNKNKNKRK